MLDCPVRLQKLHCSGLSTDQSVEAWQLASVDGALGQFGSAFAALEQAVEVRNLLLVWAKVEPRLDALRTDAVSELPEIRQVTLLHSQ